MATLKDISNRVGVSIRTVNRALKDDGYVKAEVRERVLTVARELGYRPNRMARALRTRRGYEVLVLTSSTDELQMSKISGLEERLRRDGYFTSLLMVPGGDGIAREIVGEITSRSPAGIVLFGDAGGLRGELMAHVLKDDAAYVFIGDHSGFDSVDIDRQRGVYDAVNYLAGRGCRRIAYLAFGAASDNSNQTRLTGYYRAMAELSLKPTLFGSDRGLDQFEGGRSAAGMVLGGEPAVDAVLCYTDAMAMGLMAGLSARGVRVPERLRVVGFDGRSAGAWASPPLTTVEQPNRELGAVAAEIILRKIRGEAVPSEGWSKRLPTKLVVRETA